MFRVSPPLARNLIRATLLFLSLPALARAAGWKLTDSQFQQKTVNLQSIDESGIHTLAPDGSQPGTQKWDDILEITRPAPAPPPTSGATAAKFTIYLTTGDHLGGAPFGVTDERLKWDSPGMGQIDLPLEKLAAICKAGSPASPEIEAVRTDDIVQLANGDKTHGIITQVDGNGVTIQAGDATPTLPWDAIGTVLFSTPPHAATAGRMFRIRFGDDSSITASAISLDADQVTFSMDDKTPHTLGLALIASIEQINGPVSWLTSRSPSENIYRPYFQEDFPTRFDRTTGDGKPIREKEKFKDFHHGIGCHSYSKLVYDLDGSYQTFRTQYAIDSDSPLADVTIRILLDDKPVLEKKNVKSGPIYPVISIPLGSAKKLALEVDYGENYATEDRFVWLDPALVRSSPQ